MNDFGVRSIAKDIMIKPRLINGVFFIALFYYSYYIAIPAYFLYKKYIILLLYFFTTSVVFTSVQYIMMPPFYGNNHNNFHLFGPSYNLFMYIIVCILSFSLCIYTNWQKELEAKLNTEISFLKAQINPHFLFNTLNSIYSLTITKSDDAPEAVLKLSGMMRYAVSDTGLNFVCLEKEIEYIDNYIELQKLRMDKNIQFSYNVSGEPAGKKLAPFVLIPFIENAFKYGVNAEQDSRISINIDIAEMSMQMQVWNKKVHIYSNGENSSKLGINNTRKRLQMLYPNKHKLVIYDRESDFSVLLKIDLT